MHRAARRVRADRAGSPRRALRLHSVRCGGRRAAAAAGEYGVVTDTAAADSGHAGVVRLGHGTRWSLRPGRATRPAGRA